MVARANPLIDVLMFLLLKINFANKREVELFKNACEFNAYRHSAGEKRKFWDVVCPLKSGPP